MSSDEALFETENEIFLMILNVGLAQAYAQTAAAALNGGTDEDALAEVEAEALRAIENFRRTLDKDKGFDIDLCVDRAVARLGDIFVKAQSHRFSSH